MLEYRRLDVQKTGDVTVARFRDWRIDDSNCAEVEHELAQLIEVDRCAKLLLDFSAVDLISSAGLGRLIALDQRTRKRGCSVKLCNIRPEVARVLAVTKLDGLFDIKRDEPEALASFSQPAQ